MNDYDKLQEMLMTIERDLRDLKTRKNIAGIVQAYTYEIHVSDLTTKTITYASGSQPIITDVYGYGSHVLSTVEDNEQKLFVFAQDENDLVIVSTRPITSVE